MFNSYHAREIIVSIGYTNFIPHEWGAWSKHQINTSWAQYSIKKKRKKNVVHLLLEATLELVGAITE